MIWRVRDRQTFVDLRQRGRRARSGPIWISYLPDDLEGSSSPPRVAFAFGRRLGNAVTRNRLRRRVKAIFAARAQQAAIPPGAYLVGGSPEAALLAFSELERHVNRIFHKLGPRS